MKVLILAPPLVSPGGIQRYTITLIRALKDLVGEPNVRSLAIPSNGNRCGRFSVGLKLHFGFQAIGEVVRWRPDLIICTHLALGPVAAVAATIGKRPYWVVVHGIEAWCSLPYGKRAALRQADRVIVTSAFNQEQVLKRQGIDPDRMSSLPCALDEKLLSVQATSDGRKCNLHRYFSYDRRVLLTVGRMVASERYKGHDMVLRALPAVVAEVPNLTYVLVGDGDDRARLEKLAAELGLAAHVVFTGEVSDLELAAFYRRSKVFVLPARTVIDDQSPKGEGFGIVYLEAMAFGLPIVGPNNGAPAELVDDGKNGLVVDPDDPGQIASAVIKLLSNPNAARRMGQAGRKRVLKEFSYEAFRERVRQLLDSGEFISVKQASRDATTLKGCSEFAPEPADKHVSIS